jgi:mRNA export factor
MNLSLAAKDFEVGQSPTDGISALAFSSQADMLAASSWDSKTRIYQVQPNGSTTQKAEVRHEQPALDCSWSLDGQSLLSVGCDNKGLLCDLNTGQTRQVAQHGYNFLIFRY